MRTKAGLPTITIVIISIVIMLVATAIIFLALPILEDTFKTGPCDDTCYIYKEKVIVSRYEDCEHPGQRYILHDHDGDEWQYNDTADEMFESEFKIVHRRCVEIMSAEKKD